MVMLELVKLLDERWKNIYSYSNSTQRVCRMLPESERKRAQSPKKRAEEKRQSNCYNLLLFLSWPGLKTKSEIFNWPVSRLLAFTTVLKVWQSAHPQCVHILAYNLDHYQHLCVLMNSKWPFCCGRQVWDRTAKSLLIFNPTSWFSGSSTEVCLKRFVWMFRAHYQRWNT